MASIVQSLLCLILFATPLFAKDEGPQVVPGLITANNVDITTDTGEVLDQRLNVGDPIYIVVKPKKRRDGWVRVSKTAEDNVGIGWVEEKYTRSFRKWEGPQEEAIPTEAEKAGEKTVFAPDVEPSKYGQIGVLPFTSPESDDPIASAAYGAFTLALRNDKRFQVAENLKGDKVNVEAPESIEKEIADHKLDGLFVGSLSGDMGGSRLLQVRFFGKGREGVVLEKVKKISKDGNLKEVIDSLVSSCTSALVAK